MTRIAARAGDLAARLPPASLVAVFAIIAHFRAIFGGFIWLDHAHIEAGWALAPPGHWSALFTGGFARTGFYRPLMALSLSTDALVGAPWFFHATTLAWHAAAAAMTTVASTTFGLSRRAALMAGLLFAVHPVASLVANAIAFRSEAMIAVALLTLVVAQHRGFALVAAAAILAGALTKETALVLAPIFAAVTEVAARGVRPVDAESRRVRRRLLGMETAAMAAALALRFAYAPAWRASYDTLSPSEAAGTRFASLAKSAAALAFPLDRSICDAFPVVQAWQPLALAGVLVAGAVAWLAWRRRGPATLLALTVLASLGLVPMMRWWSPHYLYLPLAFACVLIAEAVTHGGRRAQFAMVAATGACTVLAWRDDTRFVSDEALWLDEAARRPQCREAHFYLGEAARRTARWDAAAEHYEEAVRARPGTLAYVDLVAALQNLGVARIKQGRWADARATLRAALDRSTDAGEHRHIVHDIATAALGGGDPQEAAELLEREVERADPQTESMLLRARALHVLGREGEASALVDRLAHVNDARVRTGRGLLP